MTEETAASASAQEVPPPTKVVEVSDKDSLDVWVVGQGAPIVFVHGALFWSLLKPLAGAVAQTAGCQTIWYARRGYRGRATEAASVEDQAADIVRVLDALGLDKAHVVGHSAASCYVLEFASQAPDRVLSVALLDFVLPAQVPSGHMFEAAMRPVVELAQAGDLDGAATHLLAGLGCDQELMDRTLPGSWSEMLPDARTWFQVDAPALQQWMADEERTRSIKVPVAIVGVTDLPPFVETGELLTNWIPHLERLEIASGEHFFPVAATEEAAATLGEWIVAQGDAR